MFNPGNCNISMVKHLFDTSSQKLYKYVEQYSLEKKERENNLSYTNTNLFDTMLYLSRGLELFRLWYAGGVGLDLFPR